jgi:ATP-dependent Lon protease
MDLLLLKARVAYQSDRAPWSSLRGSLQKVVKIARRLTLCGSLLNKNTRGGTVVVGALNLGGSVELIPNAARIVELAIDKQAQTILMPVAARRQLNDLPDDLWTKISIEFYKDSADAVFKALVE